jgi:methylphosphotriester-DNA--protein-cysteine methyltransferase
LGCLGAFSAILLVSRSTLKVVKLVNAVTYTFVFCFATCSSQSSLVSRMAEFKNLKQPAMA